jgi:uncharacterized protein with GYD domain
MPKYLLTLSYTAQGTQGLRKDGGSKRKAAAIAAAKSIGGKVESFYFAFGHHGAYVIADLPDAASAVALSLAVNGSGAATAYTTPLITVEEMDAACKKQVGYKAPGT